MDNNVTLIGNLAADPKFEVSKNGYPRATFRLLVNRRRGEETETAGFHCIAWRDLAEHVDASCAKGTRVMVTGYFRDNLWEPEPGNRQTFQQLVCDDVGVSLRWATAEVAKVRSSNGTARSAPGGARYGNGSAAADQAAQAPAPQAPTAQSAPPPPPDMFSDGNGAPAEDPFGGDDTSPF